MKMVVKHKKRLKQEGRNLATEGPGGTRATKGARVEDCLSSHTRLLSTGSAHGFVATWAGGVSSDVGASAVDALRVCTDPRLGDDFGQRSPSVLARLAVLVVGFNQMIRASTFKAMDLASRVSRTKLKATRALSEVDFLLPTLGADPGGKHDDFRLSKGVCDGTVWVFNGEDKVGCVRVERYVFHCPVRELSKVGRVEKGVRGLYFIKENILGPGLVGGHLVAIVSLRGNCSARNAQEKDLGPGDRFAEGDTVRVLWTEEGDDSGGRSLDVLILGAQGKGNSKIVRQ